MLKSKDLPEKYRNQTKPLVIINTMYWHVNRREVVDYIVGVEMLSKIMKTVVEEKKIRIIYLSSVTSPHWDVKTYILRALNMFMLKKMRTIGVESVDISIMLHTVNDFTLDGTHYLSVDPRTQKIMGKFGPGVADAIIHYICS